MTVVLLAIPGRAQEATDPPESLEFPNAGFEEGAIDDELIGWRFSSRVEAEGRVTDEDAIEGARAFRIDGSARSGFSTLTQSFEAEPYRGLRLRYRAQVRTEGLSRSGAANLWMRVDRPDDDDGNPQRGAFDNMGDRPIRGEEWAAYEIVLDVAEDADRVVFGLFLTGQGIVFVDDVSVEVVTDTVAVTAEAPDPSEARPRRPTMDPVVVKAMQDAENAPQQSFWTWWLCLPLLGIGLSVLGLWPIRQSLGEGDTAPGIGRLRWFALRFTIVYWLLYNLPGPFTSLIGSIWRQFAAEGDTAPEWIGKLGVWHRDFEAGLAAWAGRNLFGIERELVPPNGSGDTTQGYVVLSIYFVLALGLGGLWSLAKRRPVGRDASVDLLRSYLRYVLAFAMLGYGLAKVGIDRNQFAEVNSWRLDRTWGETSPMGVVWAFMGSSRPYTIFAGLGEVLAAVLLIWRNTALLGALVAIGVMTNVVMLNFCYDVPVKIYSSHLLVMGLMILVPDVRRLFALFVRNRNPLEASTPGVWRGSARWWARWPLKLAVVSFGFAVPLWSSGKEWVEHWREEPDAAAAAEEAEAREEYLLTRRGFRWVNEVPFNR